MHCWHAYPGGRLRRAHPGTGILTLAAPARRIAVPRLASRTVTAGPGCGARVTALLKNRCRRYGRGCRSVQRSDGPGSQIRCRPLCWSGFRTTCQPAGSCRGVAHKRCDADPSVTRHARCGPIWRKVRKGAGRGGTLSRNAPPKSCGSPPAGYPASWLTPPSKPAEGSRPAQEQERADCGYCRFLRRFRRARPDGEAEGLTACSCGSDRPS